MKRTASLSILLLLTLLIACGQKPKTAKRVDDNPPKTIDSLKKKVDQKWIRQNPSLKETNSSFFSKDNESQYFVGLLQISGESVPFTWDDNLSLLPFLLASDNEIHVRQGIAADEIFKGTKIAWNKSVNGLIWFNDKAYKATIDNWYLSDLTDCPGTIIFPSLSFKKAADIPDAISNNIQGLTILPYNENFKIKSTDTELTTESGKTITGIGYDIDNDAVFDIFSYPEEMDETTIYTRLYLNIEGQWKCRWMHLEEACL